MFESPIRRDPLKQKAKFFSVQIFNQKKKNDTYGFMNDQKGSFLLSYNGISARGYNIYVIGVEAVGHASNYHTTDVQIDGQINNANTKG